MPRHCLRLTAALLASTALPIVRPASAGDILPTGGNVVYGGASMSYATARALIIQQSTQTAIVNWQAFSIGAGDRVDIRQPSAASAFLGRVTGGTSSTIAGKLDANGQVYLVNPNGVTITKTGVVNAAGFVASSLQITDADFINGKRSFKGNGKSAEVSNAGTITVGSGGYAALIGGRVSNSGLISAPLGKVGLGSGEVATIDLSGDGFLQVAAPTSIDGKKALIQNSGKIQANGGRVVMTAATARQAARNAINLTGLVEAHTISGRSGAIVIGGGSGGKVNISGKLDVSGSRHNAGGSIAVSGRAVRATGKLLASGSTGGAIALSASKVNVKGRLESTGLSQAGGVVTLTGDILEFGRALVDVSGLTGGGSVNANATKAIRLGSTSTISADATGKGDGGSVILSSLGSADVEGKISARGGAAAGNGGKIETSGATVDFRTAAIDASAAHGAAGGWLIDPSDIKIGAAEAAAIEANLKTTNVTIATSPAGSGAGDIKIVSGLSWNSAQALTLDASHALMINAPITVSGAGTLNLIAAYDPKIPTLALISFGAGDSVQFTGTPNTGQALSINGQGYKLIYSMSDFLAINNNLAGDYALAKSLDGIGATYTGALINAGDFAGTLDGLGNTISNVKVDNGPGVFDTVGANGTVEHIGLVDVNVNGPGPNGDSAGGLIGTNDGVVFQAYNTGNVSSDAENFFGTIAGGLVGVNNGTIKQSYATGTVSGGGYVDGGTAGGLVGVNNGSIDVSFATGSVTAQGDAGSHGNIASTAGGLVGVNTGAVTHSYAAGNVVAYSTVDTIGVPFTTAGGLIGNNTGTISYSYATGRVSADADGTGSGAQATAGGLVGANSGNIDHSYASGAVKAYSSAYDYSSPTSVAQAGGLVGSNGGAIAQSYAIGSVTAQSSPNALYPGPYPLSSSAAGGLVGVNFGTIFQSYAVGSVAANGGDADAFAGGLVGNNSGLVQETYATGAVSGSGDTTFLGGLIGGNSGDVKNSFWDTKTTGQFSGLGGAFAGSFSAKGLTTAQFSNVKNFAGWSFGTTPGGSGWVIVDNGGTLNNANGQAGGTRPMLLSEYSTDIVNAHQLQLITLDLNAAYKLSADLDLGPSLTNPSEVWYTAANAPSYGYGFVQIGTWTPQFDGSFDGQGHTISNLIIYRPKSSNIGLFGYVGDTGTIENVSLVGGSVTGFDRVGALVGKNHGFIINSSASTAVTGDQYVGGLAGWSYGGISNSSASGAVSGHADIGGLVGANNGYVIDAFSTGNVTGHFLVGGLVGANNSTGMISHSYATGDVSSDIYRDANQVGGLAGYNSGVISNSHASGAVDISTNLDFQEFAAGGLVGYNSGLIDSSFATGSVSGLNSVGGLVGMNGGFAVDEGLHPTITNSYASGAVSGGSGLGGLVGSNAAGSVVSKSHATGSVFGYGAVGDYITLASGIGGLIGVNDGAVTQSYADGEVSGEIAVGGLVGGNYGTIASSFASGFVHAKVSDFASGIGGLVGWNVAGASIINSYATGPVSGSSGGASAKVVGALVGLNRGVVSRSYASGDVDGVASVGGLVGDNFGKISEAYATGSVDSDAEAGGLVGKNESAGAISTSYALGAVSGSTAGGLIGQNAGTVSQTYATGLVDGGDISGGLVGESLATGVVTTSYWDIKTTGQKSGSGIAGGSFNANGLTTAQLKASLPAGFDRTIWSIIPGVTYPYLKSLQ